MAMALMAVTLLLLLVTGLLLRLLLSWGARRPPCIRGWLPWLGAALEMGKAPLEFIERARQERGPVFTVIAAGNRLTFISGDEGVSAFFASKQVNFPDAVQKPVQYTASIGKESFYKSHSDIHEMMKLRLSQNRLGPHVTRLCEEFSWHLGQLTPGGTEDLYDLVRRVMYPAVVDTLFGKGMCPTSKETLKEFENHFRTFDEGFEYGSQIPEWFLKDWSKSKQWLLNLFRNIVIEAEESKPSEDSAKTLLQHLLDTLKGNATYNNSLLLLWASQANAIPITFWSLAFIISEPDIYREAMSEITAVFGKGAQRCLNITDTDLKNLPFVKSCILEAIRLRSPGAITRKVIQPLQVYDYIIPPGDLLMLSPFWLHRDPKHFPEPETFKPERWKKANLEKNAFLDGFVAFGGGKYQCPGSASAVCAHLIRPYMNGKKKPVIDEALQPYILPISQGNSLQPKNTLRDYFQKAMVTSTSLVHLESLRWFALMEIHMLVVLFLYKYEFQLLDAVPKQSNLHLVGTQQPDRPCLVQYRLRE